MEQLILVVHVLAAVAIIALILLQQGKGAEAGASFGAGASQTVFGSRGGGNFFTRTTAIFAAIFFVTSFGLAYIAKHRASVDADAGIPAIVEQSAEAPAVVEESAIESDVPVVDTAEDETVDVPVVEEEAE